MTVAELIEQLQKLPADLPVYLADWNEGYAPDWALDLNDRPTVMSPYTTRHGLSLPKRVVIGSKP